MSKTVVVTGGTGLIGKSLVKALSERGDKVILLVRNPEKAKAELPNLAGYYAWEAMSESGEWTAALASADAVVHLAGTPVAARWDEITKSKFMTAASSAHAIWFAPSRNRKQSQKFLSLRRAWATTAIKATAKMCKR
jgi:NAD dependent epimerase/dehydratase family enzyme